MKQRIRNLLRTLAGGASRRRFEASVRPTDAFIVTYPKSGTNWLRFMIDNVLHENPGERLSLQREHTHVPNINEVYFSGGSLNEFAHLPSPRLFWVHAPYDRCLPKVVYVLRDPRDVMVSYWHWKRLGDRAFSDSLGAFVARRDHWPCRWDEHVEGWLLRHTHPRLLVVRYEEISLNARDVLKQVLGFLEIPHTDVDVDRAVAAGRFDHMKALEDELRQKGVVLGVDRRRRAAADPTERFVRRGQVGAWRDELDNESVRILESRYGATMRKVGYEVSATLSGSAPDRTERR